MATLFGTDATTLSEPRGAGAQPLSGVATPASQYTLPTGLLNVGVQVYSDLQERKKEQAKEAAKRQQTELLANYTRTRTNIANSNLPLQEKTSRMNAIDSQFQLAATEMGIMDDFKKARDLMISGGITGEVTSEAESQRKDLEEKVKFLRQNNVYVPPGTDPVVVEQLLANHAKVEQLLSEYNQSDTMLQHAQRNLKFTQEQEQLVRTENATKAINELAGTSIESFNAQAKLISDKVLAREMSEGEARAELIALQGRYVGPINSMSDHNPTLATTWRNMFEGIIDGHLNIITNRAEEGQRTISQIMNQAALASAQKDPDLVQVASLRPWLGENSLTGDIIGQQVAARILPKLVSSNFQETGVKGNNIVANSDDKPSELMTYAFIKQGISDVRSGRVSNPEEAKEGYFQATNNILSMLGDKNPGGLEATELKDVAAFLLSPEFAYVVKENGLSPTAAAAASNVFKQVYSQNMDGEIRAAFESVLPSGVISQPDLPFIDAVDVEFLDGKVKIVPKKRIIEGEAGRAREVDRYIQKHAQELEKALNQNLKIGAHLEGTTNYQKFWEDKKSELMPYLFADPDVDIPNQIYDGQEWEYIGPKGGNTRDRDNWRPVNAKPTD